MSSTDVENSSASANNTGLPVVIEFGYFKTKYVFILV